MTHTELDSQQQLVEYRRSLLGVEEHRRLDLVNQTFEIRQAFKETSKNFVFRGLACRTDTQYEMYDMFGMYTEIVDAGAFAVTLAENPKVILNVNHRDLPLASTAAKPEATLRLWESNDGLEVEALLSKRQARAVDIVDAIRRGDVDEMSFAFRVVKQLWSRDWMQRNIQQVNLHRGDVSIVTYGANPETEAEVLARRSEEKPEPDHAGSVDDRTARDMLLARQRQDEADVEAMLAESERRLGSDVVAGLAASETAGDATAETDIDTEQRTDSDSDTSKVRLSADELREFVEAAMPLAGTVIDSEALTSELIESELAGTGEGVAADDQRSSEDETDDSEQRSSEHETGSDDGDDTGHEPVAFLSDIFGTSGEVRRVNDTTFEMTDQDGNTRRFVLQPVEDRSATETTGDDNDDAESATEDSTRNDDPAGNDGTVGDGTGPSNES